MDYKVSLGASVRTKDIDKQVKDYKGNINVGVNPEGIISGIDTAIKGYNASPIQVGTTLVTKGITDKITSLNKEANRKNIKIGVDPVFDGIEGVIKNKTFNTPLKVNVELNWAGVAKQITNPNFGTGEIPKFKLDVELDDAAFLNALDKYKKSDKSKFVPFQVKPIMSPDAWNEVEAILGGYEAKNKLKVSLDLSKTEINKKITEYNQQLSEDGGRKILLSAELKGDAINAAIANFKTKNTKELSIPIDLTLNNAEGIELDGEIKAKLKEYQGTPIWIPVKLKPAEKGFTNQLSKLPVYMEAKLKNPEDISKAINAYVENPVLVPVKLTPAKTGFIDSVTKTPIQIQAELAPDAINNAIVNPPKNLSKIPIGITLTQKDANDINNQVKQLATLVNEKLNIGVDLNETSVNSAISVFKPTATLGVDVDLNIENVDEQIRAYNPKEQIKVNVLFDDNNIDPVTGNQIKREPIVVDVKLNREGVNEQINKINPSAKVKVGVKLDFASHKDENGNEIQKGVAKQIKDYDGKTKIKVGIQLDDGDIATQIQGIDTGAPVKLGVELDKDSVLKQVEEIRQQLQSLGNITVHFGSDVVDAAESIAKTGDSNSDAAKAAQKVIRQTQKIISDDAEKSIKKVTSKGIGKYFRISKAGSEAFENEMQNLVNTWTKGKGSLVGIKIKTETSWDEDAQRNVERLHQAQVEYNDELGVTQKKTIAWRQIGVKTVKGQQEAVYGFAEVSANYSKSIDKTQSKADKFAKQQKRAASELTNQINQVHRDALDQNANRPIKEQANLTALSNKYKEITDAIKSMGTASSDTFDEEQNRVRQLISEYKSMKSEFKNAENVANKMTGTDYQSGRSIAEQNLEEFKAKAKEYPQIAKTIGELDGAFKKVGDASSLKEFNNQLRVAKAELAKVKAEANITKMEEKLGIDSSKLKNNIADLSNANPELVNFKTNINGVEVSVESLLNDLGQVKTKADFDSVNTKFKQFAEAAKNAGVALNGTVVKAQTISDIKNKLADTGFNGFSQEIKRAHTDVEAMSASMKNLGISSDGLQVALNNVDAAFEKINAAEETGDMKALQLANEEYENSLERLTSLMLMFKQAKDAAFSSENLELDKANAIMKLESIFEQGSQAAKRFGNRMQELKNKIHDCASDNGMKLINKEISIFEKDVNNSNLRTKTFSTSVKEQFQRYSQYLSVSSALMYAGQALRSMFEQVKSIDSAMTELKKVTDETDESYNQFLKNAASRSKELGTTIDGLIGSTADFARLGYSFEQSQGLAEVANIYAVVGDEIEGVEDATQSLVSTLAAFKHEMGNLDESEFALSIVDKMNEVSNNFAISSGGIGAALQRSASSMAAANNSLDETIALITAANTVVQNPEKVGNGFKTMSMRIRGAKTELEEMGESTEGMAESTASLREEILALSGVDIMLDNDTFKSTYDIMDELSQKWEGLSDIAQATITELVAGKHQGNVMSSLMANFDIARDALNTSLNSSGSAMAEHAKWSESLEARLNKLKAAWQSLSQTFMKSDFLKVLIDVAIAIIDTLDKIIDKTGIILPILTVFAGKKIFSKIFDTAKMMQFGGGLVSVGDALSVLTNAFPALTAASNAFGASIAANNTKLLALKAGAGAFVGALNPVVLGVTAAVAAIGIGLSLYDKYTESAEELAERIEEVTTKYKDQHSELSKLKGDYDTSKEDSMISRYGELSKGVNELGENLALTADEYAEYQNIVEQIASTNPDLIAGYNSQGDAILNCAGNVDALAESYKNLIKEQNREILTGKDENDKLKDNFSNAKDILKDFNNELNKEFDGITHKGAVSGMDWLEDILGKGALRDGDIEDAVNNLSGIQAMEISRLIEENGIKRDVLGSGDWGYETFQEHVIRAVKENKSEIESAIKDVRSNVDSYSESLGNVTSAYFEQAFLGGDDELGIGNYSSKISDRIQGILNQTAANLDGISYIDIIGDSDTNDAKWQALTDFYNSTLDAFAKMNKSDAAKFEAAFDLKTQFNGGDISYGEYVYGVQEAGGLIDDLGLHDEVVKQIKLSLGLVDTDGDNKNWSIQEYETLLNRLTSKEFEIQLDKDKAKSWIDNLTSTELNVTMGFIESKDADFSGALQNYRDVLDEAEQSGVDFSKTVYGNIDTNARQVLEWNSENLEKYKDAIMSWTDDDASWDNIRKQYENTISTVDANLSSYEIDGKEVDFAITPLLQTDSGAEYLSSGVVDTYINELIAKATEDGKWDNAELISLDAEGIEIDGQKIKGVIADIGETAEVTSQQMHFVGKDGALALAESEILAMVEERAKISEALSFNTSIDIDKTALETFNTALGESVSAMGLTSESISALESKYKKLEGYDSAKLFEATANGVKVNREEVAKLEKQYQDLQKSKTEKHLETLVGEYNRLTSEIDKNNNAAERASLIAEREGYLSKIEELAQYQAQLEGVTGAYQRWIDAQNTSEDYEGYEAVAKGWETVKDEISRGLLGNASKEYIDLLSGADLRGKGVDAYVEAWNKLDDKITSTGYSVKDFFTLDDDGNITSTGIHRFFDSINKEFEGTIYKLNSETGEYYYDFTEDNLNAIQEKWGIGIEAIGLMLEAAVAAGYNVDWAGLLDNIELDTSNFEQFVEYAEAAQKAFNELSDVDDVDFNFKTTNVEDATSELEKAQSIYQELITNDDGSINFNASGAQEMYVILTTLLVQKQQLEDSNIAINVDTSGLDESQQDIANAINAVKDFREKYKNLEIAVTTGQDIDKAKTELGNALGELQGLGDKGIDIAAKLIFGEASNGEALKGELDAALAVIGENSEIPVGFKLDETKLGALNSQLLTNFTPEATVKVTKIDDALVSEYESDKKEAKGEVKWSNDDSLVIEFQNTNHSANGTVYWDDNTVNLKTTYTGKGIVYWDTSEANGTANVDGTTSGRAFSRGNWGIKGSGTALGGELGMETLVRDGHFYTIGDNGAEFFKYKQGDIIFNHKQTEELFKNGKVTSNGGRGRMFANGSAFANGSYPSSGRAFWKAYASFAGKALQQSAYDSAITKKKKEVVTVTPPEEPIDPNPNPNPNPNGGSSKEDFEEIIDWIEKKIDRIQRAIDSLDQKANSVYKSWSERNTALVEEIGKVGDEIDLQQQAYDRYIQQANSVGLSEDYASKVRDGTIDIETIKDEELKKKIDEYQQWYDKALGCEKAIEDLKETESELYAQRFEHVQSQYDAILQGYEHTESMLNEYISQAEEQGYIVSKKYYDALIENEKSNIAELEKEQADLINARDEAVASGTITKYSEEWYNMCNEIDGVTQAIEESTTSLLEFDNAMREIDWQIFDLIQERISGVSSEADFLIELMSNKKLFDDDGKLTSQGLATMGLHAQNYNTHMYQADTYGEEIASLNQQIASDPYDQELINRRNELIELQRESILAAEEEKNSIRDMVEEGINLELDALQERIDKYNESIDAAKDLYDYQKDVKEQSEEIASLEKQRAAYLGNDSEEGKAKLQEIEVSLKEAKENLQETEYEKYISDQQALLDTLYSEYELILNQRLDNVDYLLEQVITSINTTVGADGIIASALGNEGALAMAIGNNATSIKSTLESESNKVGITLSSAMNNIWSAGEGNAKSVLTMYGEDFKTKSTTIITTLNGIKSSVDSMISSTNKNAEKKVSANKTSTSAKKNPTTSSTTKSGTTTNKSSGGDGVPKVGDKVKFVSGQYYYDSQGQTPIGSSNLGKYVYITKVNNKSWATHPYHIATDKDGKHPLGWLKLNQISGYATGKKNFFEDEIAWTQENGKEFVVRPSDGAILTPVAKGDSILNSVASNNIWNMANSPAEFIKDNLNLGAANVPSSNVQNSYVQHFENVTFSMPNVHGYNELLAEMQKDKSFEKLIMSMTIDRIAGKSSLAKGKTIR